MITEWSWGRGLGCRPTLNQSWSWFDSTLNYNIWPISWPILIFVIVQAEAEGLPAPIDGAFWGGRLKFMRTKFENAKNAFANSSLSPFQNVFKLWRWFRIYSNAKFCCNMRQIFFSDKCEMCSCHCLHSWKPRWLRPLKSLVMEKIILWFEVFLKL